MKLTNEYGARRAVLQIIMLRKLVPSCTVWIRFWDWAKEGKFWNEPSKNYKLSDSKFDRESIFHHLWRWWKGKWLQLALWGVHSNRKPIYPIIQISILYFCPGGNAETETVDSVPSSSPSRRARGRGRGRASMPAPSVGGGAEKSLRQRLLAIYHAVYDCEVTEQNSDNLEMWLSTFNLTAACFEVASVVVNFLHKTLECSKTYWSPVTVAFLCHGVSNFVGPMCTYIR